MILGADGIIAALYGLLLFLARHKEKQARVRQDVLSFNENKQQNENGNEVPDLKNHHFWLSKSNYSKAFLSECQRFVSQAGMGAPHLATRDLHHEGLVIKEGVSSSLFCFYK